MLKTGEEMKTLDDDNRARHGDDKCDLDLEPELTEEEAEERGHWGNHAEFFLAIVGFTIGIGSVWRFPITCSRNGGGAFLVPFFFFLLTCGGPLYYLEVCLGQFSGKSAGLAFEFCPLLKGLGFLQVSLALTVAWYGVFISAWTYYYLYSSFFPTLPWSTCTNAWNTPSCKDYEMSSSNHNASNSSILNVSEIILEGHDNDRYRSPALEFWNYKAIGRSSGMGDVGGLQLHLVVCMTLAWILVALAVIKGARSLGKVVYVTATAPYLFLTIMFIRGLTLDGALDGVLAFLTPDFGKLFTVQTWLEAAIQVFYSLGPTWGGVITMASYNRFHQQSFWSTALCVAICGFTSFFNGLVVFTILGFMAKSSGLPLDEVAKQSGPGLTFVAFPTALSKMPIPHLWSVLFFLMLVTVTFDSLFGMFETVSSGVIDLFPHRLTSKRVLVNVGVAIFFIVSGLPLCLNNGIYIFQVSDWYFSQFALLFGSFFEAVAVCWFYGTDRFAHDISLMTGRDVSIVLRVVWTVFIPVAIFITFVVMLSKYSAPAYGDGYVYDTGSIAYGIAVGLLPIVGMICIGVLMMWRAQGTLMERLRQCSRPNKHWLPCDSEARRTYKLQPYSSPDSLKQRIWTDLRGANDNPVF